MNKVDEFTRSRAPDAPSTDTAASLAALTPQNLIDRRLYATKLAALNQLEQHLKKVRREVGSGTGLFISYPAHHHHCPLRA